MSTIALPEQQQELIQSVDWSFYAEEEVESEDPLLFHSYHSKDGLSWTDIAHEETIDGTLLHVSNKPGYRLYLYPDFSDTNHLLRIEPPEPVPMFAFTRWAQPLDYVGTPLLRYSCFGYILPDYLFVVRIFPPCPFVVTEQRLLKRPCTFLS